MIDIQAVDRHRQARPEWCGRLIESRAQRIHRRLPAIADDHKLAIDDASFTGVQVCKQTDCISRNGRERRRRRAAGDVHFVNGFGGWKFLRCCSEQIGARVFTGRRPGKNDARPIPTDAPRIWTFECTERDVGCIDAGDAAAPRTAVAGGRERRACSVSDIGFIFNDAAQHGLLAVHTHDEPRITGGEQRCLDALFQHAWHTPNRTRMRRKHAEQSGQRCAREAHPQQRALLVRLVRVEIRHRARRTWASLSALRS
jgi:hypothetical protein